MKNSSFLLPILILITCSCNNKIKTQSFSPIDVDTISVFPLLAEINPDGPSPGITENGRELILAGFENNQFSWFDVTAENTDILNYKEKWEGKGMQLKADEFDFPTLANKGLHSEKELRSTLMITGYSVSEITYHGRPWRSSGAGFMADDETILSIIWADNKTVKKLGITHSDLARPLFHLWNAGRIMEKAESRLYLNKLIYNERLLSVKFSGSRGWQESIFDDEILGSYQFEVGRKIEAEEEEFLKIHYSELGEDKLSELKRNISFLHTGEMVAFYINRYGFYEGHTDYRTDPITIAFIFGLRTIEKLHEAADGDLYGYFNSHFTENPEYKERRARKQDKRPRIKSGAGSRQNGSTLSENTQESESSLNLQPATRNPEPETIDSLVSALASAGRNWNIPAEKLIAIGDPAVPSLVDLLFDKTETQWSRRVAAMTLNQMHSPLTLEPGLKLLFDEEEDWLLRNHIIPSLRGFDLSSLKEELWEIFLDGESGKHWANVAGLLKTADTALAYQAYQKLYNTSDGYGKMSSLRELAQLRPHEATSWYLEGLQDEDWWTSKTASDSLIGLVNPDVNRLEDIFNQADTDELRWKITHIFRKLNLPESEQFMDKACMDSSWLVRMEAMAGREGKRARGQ